MAMLRESALEEKALSQKNGESMLQRKRIRDAVLAGEIDEAIEHTNLIAPELFMSQPSVLFELKCQKFVEMVRNGDDEATMAYGRTELCDFETESEDNKLHLQEVFSLLAYPHPENSPLGYLFEVSRRQCVAEALNEAILGENHEDHSLNELKSINFSAFWHHAVILSQHGTSYISS
jgi:hypothetical protein